MHPSDIAPLVCIPTAGSGTRLGKLGSVLNKALLPIGKQAVISRIFEKFPSNSKFIIALGNKSDQVKSYICAAHPNLDVEYCQVDNYNQPGSGPGYSLLCCKEKLQRPFFFVSCDTLWDEEIPLDAEYDWFGVAKVPPSESNQYCNFELNQNTIVKVIDKAHVEGENFRAFTGLCYIKNYNEFWKALEKPSLVKGEHQLSSGIELLIQNHSPHAVDITWYDTGTEAKYKALNEKYEEYDFSKPDETLYIINAKVIKFFADENISNNRVARAKQKPIAFPNITHNAHGFFSYPFIAGRTLYEDCSTKVFDDFLNWLESNLWQRIDADSAKVKTLCTKFYKNKTLERLDAYHKKYNEESETCINSHIVPSTQSLLSKVPWDQLSDGIPVVFHGDLQFDNVLFDRVTNKFTLLDWRQDFAGELQFGDLYYDLAKLNGGLTLNYDYIKKGLFSYSEHDNHIDLDFAQRMLMSDYKKILYQFIESRGLSLPKVKILTAIIFLNMSPLHSNPFDKLLYSLGRLYLHNELQKW
jgi:NDP-sugar pyrophosphorylase family protein